MSKRTEILLLLGILAAGALLRVAYLHEVIQSPRFDHPTSDAAFNDYFARALLADDWTAPGTRTGPLIAEAPFYKAPGYLYFLAFVYKVTGGSFLWTRIIQLLIGLGSCFLAYVLGRRIFDPPVGLITAALMAAYWIFPYYESTLHAPVIVVFLSLLTILVLHAWLSGMSFRKALATGLLIGIFGLIRKNVFLFVPLALIWAWMIPSPGVTYRRIVGGMLLGILLVIAPITIRNHGVSGEWVWISCDAGRNLYMGNNDQTDGSHGILPDVESLTPSGSLNLFTYPEVVRGLSRQLERPVSYKEAEKIFSRKAMTYMKDHPLRTLELMVRKAFILLGPVEVSTDEVVHYDRKASRILSHVPGGFSLVLSLCVVGTVMLTRRKARLKPGSGMALVLIALFLGTLFFSFLLGPQESRYRMGMMPFMLMMGAYGIHGVVRMLADRQLKRAAVYVVGFAAVFTLASINVSGYEPDLAKWHYENGVVHEKAGDKQQAAAHYNAAIGERRDFVQAYNNLGILLAREKRFAEAEACFQEAMKLDPTHTKALNSYATMLLQAGEVDAAVQRLRSAIVLQPGNPVTYNNLGTATFRSGNLYLAMRHYERAIEIDPLYAEAYSNLGAVHARMGRRKKAMQYFEKALVLHPGHAHALANLAKVQQLLKENETVDQPEAAEQ